MDDLEQLPPGTRVAVLELTTRVAWRGTVYRDDGDLVVLVRRAGTDEITGVPRFLVRPAKTRKARP